jgi:hypothetical protein
MLKRKDFAPPSYSSVIEESTKHLFFISLLALGVGD